MRRKPSSSPPTLPFINAEGRSTHAHTHTNTQMNIENLVVVPEASELLAPVVAEEVVQKGLGLAGPLEEQAGPE